MSDPVKVHRVIEHQDSAGTPIVLIHGVGTNHHVWDEVLPVLGDRAPIIRYDLRGHGRSERPPAPYSLDDFVEDHLALLRELEIDRAHVVGFSLGGLIAQAIALTYPRSVDQLVLIGTVAGRTPQERDRVLKRMADIEALGPAGVARASAERWFTKEFRDRHPEAVQEKLRVLSANDPDAYLAAYRVLATNDLADQLHRIAARCLVMTGSGDVGSPPHMAELIAERVPDCELGVIDGVKHAVLNEQPTVVGTYIRDFLYRDTVEKR